MQKTNIAIIEDEPIVRESLTALFLKQPDIAVHTQAGSVEEFLEHKGLEDIRILLLDINLPGQSGLEGMRTLKKCMPNADIAVLTTYEDEDVIFKALCGGATAYISKRTPLPEVLSAVRTVLGGGSYMSPFIARKVMQYFAPVKKTREEELTPRQQQIVQALKDGYSYKMIAEKYMISVHTVGDHIKAIYRKLQINSKGELFSKGLKGEV